MNIVISTPGDTPSDACCRAVAKMVVFHTIRTGDPVTVTVNAPVQNPKSDEEQLNRT